MKSIIVRNGLYAAIFLIGVGALPLLFLGIPGPEDFKRGEIIGYASIVLSMIFVFFGIRQYREIENGGMLGFWEAVKIGLGIAAFPAIAFGLYNILYTEVIDPDFLSKYTSYMISEAKANKTAAEVEALKAQITEQYEQFGNPFFQFFVMFLTVFIIGLIVSILSAFILKRTES